MNSSNSHEHRQTKFERRDEARQKAKVFRDEQKKKAKRQRLVVQGSIALTVVAVLAIISLFFVNSVKAARPGPRNMASDGIVIGKDLKAFPTAALAPNLDPIPSKPDTSGTVANIRVYLDYLCPYCGQFEKTNSEQMAKWLKSGAATLEIHPIPLLTSKSAGTQYSLRATNAAACVADMSADHFFVFNTLLFENQPAEGSPGLSDATIKKLVRESGVKKPEKINECINKLTFKSWANAARDRALTQRLPGSEIKSLTGTPTILVNGKQYQDNLNDPKTFAAFVLQATGETYSTATPNPTPAPTG